MDRGDVGVLVLLDLSAAFDSVDHATLIERLSITCGLNEHALSWISSYLHGRTQQVVYNNSTSNMAAVTCGVPQGSVLGPMLFTLYIADLAPLIERHQLVPNLYADDKQVAGYCKPSNVSSLQNSVSDCLTEVSDWMRSNRLQLNTGKTEVIWVGSSHKQHLLPTVPF